MRLCVFDLVQWSAKPSPALPFNSTLEGLDSIKLSGQCHHSTIHTIRQWHQFFDSHLGSLALLSYVVEYYPSIHFYAQFEQISRHMRHNSTLKTRLSYFLSSIWVKNIDWSTSPTINFAWPQANEISIIPKHNTCK